MAALWHSHDIFLQVSDFEGTSVSMLEAMAQGAVPVVTAASSGIAGVIKHQDNGFVVPVGDMTAMANVIAQLAGDEASLAVAGRAAHRTAQAYSMDLYVEKFERILDQVAGADHEVDYKARYGMFAPSHPLFVQQQMTENMQIEIDRLKRRSGNRLFNRGLNRLRRSMMRRGPRGDQRAA